ncbi:MAG: hypothetical protein KDI04_06005 [Halieaceae bacterium]|nr:hypothetical protein [Halieaceae bacterium]MCP5147529.1 hypothetical protein [Pseudomonadales bacterium]MCP5166178.1 hypothetical protein [Pseudomonadales bacterium]MCP5187139.1 hypothetical protein [Pseudomonadales bacterium]
MKILYGVQGTGQGHISRARAMVQALGRHDVEVTWLFSGRRRQDLFDMDCFGDFEHRRGLTFVTRNGRIRPFASLATNNLVEFARDVRSLQLQAFDLVVSDFEPVTAWAGRRAGLRTIGIGHQYAFGPRTPRAGQSWWAERLLAHFAPVMQPLGLHWHRYGSNVLPPILDLPALPLSLGQQVLVYLPFEDQDKVSELLQRLPQQSFVQYAPGLQDGQLANVTRCQPGTERFKAHLASCRGVICNSGFELISECLHWGKPVLTRPLRGQMEQESNARALADLGYARVAAELTPRVLAQWLQQTGPAPRLAFPDVAGALASWLAAGAATEPAALVRDLWLQTRAAPAQQVAPPATRRYHGRWRGSAAA